MSITACSLEPVQCLLSNLIENITNFKWVLYITSKVKSEGDIQAAWKMADKIKCHHGENFSQRWNIRLILKIPLRAVVQPPNVPAFWEVVKEKVNVLPNKSYAKAIHWK